MISKLEEHFGKQYDIILLNWVTIYPIKFITISSYTYIVGILACEHQQTCTRRALEAQFIKADNFNNKPEHHKQNLKVN